MEDLRRQNEILIDKMGGNLAKHTQTEAAILAFRLYHRFMKLDTDTRFAMIETALVKDIPDITERQMRISKTSEMEALTLTLPIAYSRMLLTRICARCGFPRSLKNVNIWQLPHA